MRKTGFIAICMIVIFIFSACADDSSRLVGDWIGATGGWTRRYEFNRDGTGAWVTAAMLQPNRYGTKIWVAILRHGPIIPSPLPGALPATY